MKKLIYLVLMLCTPVAGFAQDEQPADSLEVVQSKTADVLSQGSKNDADSAYIRNDYTAAIQIYESLLKEGVSADIYYNLGNSYYKAGEIGKAILNYERALLINPSNSDIKANLQIAQSKAIDKVEKIPELFYVTWYRNIASSTAADTWGIWGIILFWTALAAILLFIFSHTSLLKKIGFFGALSSLVLVILFNSFANYQQNKMEDKSSAIVLSPSVTVRSTPSESGTSLFILHEGHKVTIKDNSMSQWKEIVLEDGKVGWITTSSIEII